ncbi:hypothetical protein NU09_0362 [Flavobacterium beibuense]|uniref:Uncharacterized protein n=2 Tax=Flavobacterium beibuense TaxID=657326 RepID=A0A444WIS9_9FLAO|nr:hypothetical protein NU09_0362 [Flavobacterium beibuense]
MTSPLTMCQPVSKGTYDYWTGLIDKKKEAMGTPIEEIIDPELNPADVTYIEVKESNEVNGVKIIAKRYPVQDGIVYFELE